MSSLQSEILAKTGLRISELCGLTIMDVDFIHEVVVIDHQLLKSKEPGYYIETPKTKSGTRQVPLSRETIQAFQRVMKKRPKAEPFVIDGRSNFLFVNHKGKPKVAIDYSTLFVRMVLSSELDAPAPCRLNAPDLDFACRTSADCLHQHQQVI